MYRFAYIVLPLVVLLHATTTSAVLEISQCQKITGLTNETALRIPDDSDFSDNGDALFKSSLCYWICTGELVPVGLVNDDGTINARELNEYLKRLSDGESTIETSDIIFKKCAKEAIGDYCDSVVGGSRCLYQELVKLASTAE